MHQLNYRHIGGKRPAAAIGQHAQCSPHHAFRHTPEYDNHTFIPCNFAAGVAAAIVVNIVMLILCA